MPEEVLKDALTNVASVEEYAFSPNRFFEREERFLEKGELGFGVWSDNVDADMSAVTLSVLMNNSGLIYCLKCSFHVQYLHRLGCLLTSERRQSQNYRIH